MSITLRESVLQYANGIGNQHIVQVHTFDGVDRTFQSSGAGNEPINLHKQASMTLEDLVIKVRGSGLPLEWLLAVTIIVESYDRLAHKQVTSTWAVVFVPMHTTVGDNLNGTGFQVVNIGEEWVLYPDAQALDIEIGV